MTSSAASLVGGRGLEVVKVIGPTVGALVGVITLLLNIGELGTSERMARRIDRALSTSARLPEGSVRGHFEQFARKEALQLAARRAIRLPASTIAIGIALPVTMQAVPIFLYLNRGFVLWWQWGLVAYMLPIYMFGLSLNIADIVRVRRNRREFVRQGGRPLWEPVPPTVIHKFFELYMETGYKVFFSNRKRKRNAALGDQSL